MGTVERIEAVVDYRAKVSLVLPGFSPVPSLPSALPDFWEAGFQIKTTAQTITLAIDDVPSCCEQWGYFLTEDDPGKFIGAELRGVSITDTNRSTLGFMTERDLTGWNAPDTDGEGREIEHLEYGDVMFVDIQTDRGVLQFVAYNAHNGYYGHSARVSSRQLEYEVAL